MNAINNAVYPRPEIHPRLTFSAWLGRYLGSMGWSQTMLGKAVECNPQTAHNWVAGGRVPQMKHMLRICRLLSALFGVELSEMILQAAAAAEVTIQKEQC